MWQALQLDSEHLDSENISLFSVFIVLSAMAQQNIKSRMKKRKKKEIGEEEKDNKKEKE